MKWQLARKRLNSGGYDTQGYYWGIGQPLWQYGRADGIGVWHYTRALTRDKAKAYIRESKDKDASFYR